MTEGLHHIGLSVIDLKDAKNFFVDYLKFSVVREDLSHPNCFVSDGNVMVTLWQIRKDEAVSFDRSKNLGLHHLALKVTPSDLYHIYQAMKDSAYSIEFAPEPLRGGPTEHFMMNGPSGIRIEFIAPK